MNAIVRYLRGENDPEIIEGGPSSLTSVDRLAKSLGWLSLGLGLTGMFAARRIARAIGLENKASLIRLFGLREIGTGVTTLSPDKRFGLWGRVGGNVMDLLLLATALDAPRAHQRRNARLALAAVAGITILDVVAARAMTLQQARAGTPRKFDDRSGFPRGIDTARGAAKGFRAPVDMRDSMRTRARG